MRAHLLREPLHASPSPHTAPWRVSPLLRRQRSSCRNRDPAPASPAGSSVAPPHRAAAAPPDCLPLHGPTQPIHRRAHICATSSTSFIASCPPLASISMLKHRPSTSEHSYSLPLAPPSRSVTLTMQASKRRLRMDHSWGHGWVIVALRITM